MEIVKQVFLLAILPQMTTSNSVIPSTVSASISASEIRPKRALRLREECVSALLKLQGSVLYFLTSILFFSSSSQQEHIFAFRSM